jgi:hypothetical protein
MRIMHMQNLMDAPIPKEMANLTPLTAIAVGTMDKLPVEWTPPLGGAPEAGGEVTAPPTALFKIPKLSKAQQAASPNPSEEGRREAPPPRKDSPRGDEAMVVDLDLEVSDEDRRFVESSAPDSVDKMLDDFIGDKNSPVQSTLKPSLKKPEDTVKKLTGAAANKLSFMDDPPRSALSLAAAALKKTPKPSKTVSESDEAEMRQLVKTLSSAQRAAFQKMLTSTLPPSKKIARKSRK